MESSSGYLLSPVRTEEQDIARCTSRWTKEEDNKLKELIQKFKLDWDIIKRYLPNKTTLQCQQRWKNVLNPKIVKGPWTKEEDDQVISLVERYGTKKWTVIASHMKGRLGKQCRERWHNHLNPKLKRTPWTTEEDIVIIKAHKMYGNHWSKIAKLLQGRSDNSIKNHWNSSIKKQYEITEEREIIHSSVNVSTEINPKTNITDSVLNSPDYQRNICEEVNQHSNSWSPLQFISSKFLDNSVFCHDDKPIVQNTYVSPSKEAESILESLFTIGNNRTPDNTPLKIKQDFGTPQTPTPFKKILANIEKKIKYKFTDSQSSKRDIPGKEDISSMSYHGKENTKPMKNACRVLSFTKAEVLETNDNDPFTDDCNLVGYRFPQHNVELCETLLNLKPFLFKETDLDSKHKLPIDVEKWATVACGYTKDQLILTNLAYRYLKGEGEQ